MAPGPVPISTPDAAAQPLAWRWGLPLVLLVAVAIALPMLGWAGLSSSEGHRAVPGWTMLDSGEYLRVRLFGATYIRKPPGMPWVIALSSAAFGRTEFAARLPSALGFIAMAGAAWFFARRWFGPRAAIVAGLAQALMPAMWPWARSAEIECLCALSTQLASFLLFDLLMERDPRAASLSGSALRPRPWAALGLALSLVAMMLLKGPAGLPVVLGAALGACAARASLRPLLRPALAAALVLAAAILAPLGWAIARANADPDAIRQGVSEFLWSRERLSGILSLIPLALASGLPASLALLFPWGPDARSEGARPEFADAYLRARGLAIAAGGAMLIYALAGVSNHRYLLPALPLLPPLAAYVAVGAVAGGAFTPLRRTLARLCVLGHPRVMAGALLIAGAIWIPLQERSRERNSGRAAGIELAGELPPHSVVIADSAIDARPEIGWYLLAARPPGDAIVRWTRGLHPIGISPQTPLHFLVRTDPAGDERPLLGPPKERARLRERGSVRVGEYALTLYQLGGPEPVNSAQTPR